jgi:hypothetical protein
MTDSTTSEGWTRKTNFKKEMDNVQATVRIEVARNHATKYMNNGIREYSQWFLGSQNNVADALSRDIDRADAELTQILFTHVPSQVPSTFKIVPLPNKIVCWVALLLQKLPVQKRYREVHTKTTLGCGDGGKNIASRQGSEKISSSRNSQKKIEATSSGLSPWLYVKGDFCNHVMLPWLQAHSAVLWATWQQPSGVTDTQTSHTTSMET